MLNIQKLIGERIRLYRKKLGYTQEKLAEKAELHPTYIGQIERGEKNATIELIYKIILSLDISFETLLENIVQSNNEKTVASECYELINSLSAKEQIKVYDILKNIIEYRNL